MSDVLKLSFLTTNNEKVTLTVPKAYRELDDADVKNAMEAIVNSRAIFVNNANLGSSLGAELYSVTEKEFNI